LSINNNALSKLDICKAVGPYELSISV
jgi:hypothetical protein